LAVLLFDSLLNGVGDLLHRFPLAGKDVDGLPQQLGQTLPGRGNLGTGLLL